jgi:hypothetical protein
MRSHGLAGGPGGLREYFDRQPIWGWYLSFCGPNGIFNRGPWESNIQNEKCYVRVRIDENLVEFEGAKCQKIEHLLERMDFHYRFYLRSAMREYGRG